MEHCYLIYQFRFFKILLTERCTLPIQMCIRDIDLNSVYNEIICMICICNEQIFGS